MFSMMNYYLPLDGIASMHCSANTDMDGKNTAIFFGLSGTGKTTLSTDPKRLLIGDDEHGWDDNGVFNFEGGCYAKVIDLDAESEPDIYNAIRRDALLENVTVDANGKIDFADKSVTENTRVSYPIDHIENIVRPISSAPAAQNVIFLSADAFGVLPPVSILTPEQTQYYFLSGFTAKLAGTERGITEPTPTFSACFGQAFLELHPTKYAEELVKKMEKSGAKAYLVNTGWNGTGKRISIKDTRGIIDAILNGDIKKIIQDINSDYDMKKLKFLRNGNEHYISTHLSDSPEKDKFKVDIKALIYIKDEIVYGDVQKINIQTDNMNREEMKILKNKVSIIQNKKSKYIELLSLCIEQMGIVFKNGDFYLNQKKHFLPEYSTPLCVEKDICSKCEILEVKYGELREELRSVIDMINKNVLVAMNFISYYDSEQLCNPCKQ